MKKLFINTAAATVANLMSYKLIKVNEYKEEEKKKEILKKTASSSIINYFKKVEENCQKYK